MSALAYSILIISVFFGLILFLILYRQYKESKGRINQRSSTIKKKYTGQHISKGWMFFIIGALLAISLLTFIFVVPAGNKGVIFNTFTGIKPQVYDEGMHFKWSLFEQSHKFEVRTRVYNQDASAASKDLQIVSTKVALNYHV